MAHAFVEFYKRHLNVPFMSSYKTDNDVWHIMGEKQTDWYVALFQVFEDFWCVKRTKGNVAVLEVWDNGGCIYEKENVNVNVNVNDELALLEDDGTIDNFADWYHDAFYPHMFLHGDGKDSWRITPPNQSDWFVTIVKQLGFWIVVALKEGEDEDLVKVYNVDKSLIWSGNVACF